MWSGYQHVLRRKVWTSEHPPVRGKNVKTFTSLRIGGGHRGTRVNGSHHGGSPLLWTTGIKIATKPLPGSTTREYRKLLGVKTMSLGTNYTFYCLKCCQSFRIWITSYRKDVMCCPTTKVMKRDPKRSRITVALSSQAKYTVYPTSWPF